LSASSLLAQSTVLHNMSQRLYSDIVREERPWHQGQIFMALASRSTALASKVQVLASWIGALALRVWPRLHHITASVISRNVLSVCNLFGW